MKKIKTLREAELYYIGLGLWIITRLLEQSMFTVTYPVSNITFKAVEFLALFVMAIDEMSLVGTKRLKIIPCLLLLVASILSSFNSDRMYIMQLVFILLISSDKEHTRILRTAMISIAFILLVIPLLSIVDLIPNYMFLWGGRERYGLGFKYATYLPALLYISILLYGYLKHNGLSFRYVAVCLACESLAFLLTDSRFLCLMGAMSSVILTVVSRISSNKNIIAILKVAPYLFFILPFVSIVVALSYDPSIFMFARINDLLSNRLFLCQNALLEWGLTPFGQVLDIGAITWDSGVAALPDEVNVIDNSYLNCLIAYGIVISIIFFYLFYKFGIMAYNNRDGKLLFILISISIMGLFEPRLFLIEYNPFFVLLGTIVCNTSNYSISHLNIAVSKNP